MMIARHVRKLEGYVPGEQPKSKSVVKLNTNENPYPPSPKCAEVLKRFDPDLLRRYPDPDATELRQALAKFARAKAENIFVGNGSDEILALAAKTFVENDESIGSLDPSYSLYKTLAAIRDVRWVGVEGARRGTRDASGDAIPQDLTSHVSRLSPSVSLFLLTNPNAPTGEWREPAAIARFAKSFRGVVLVDEAYADFARGNCLALATDPKNRNVIVMRTFSKSFSLAGLRVGWCVGPKDLIDALYKMKDSYNVDAVAQRVALAAVRDAKWMRANVKKVVATRARVTAELTRRGWDVIPSESNFLFARPPRRRGLAVRVGDAMKQLSTDADCKSASTATGTDCKSASTATDADCKSASTATGTDCKSASTATGADCKSASTATDADCKSASAIFSALRERNIFVRYFSGPKTGDRLRVTIGTDAQMNKFLKAIDELSFKS